MYWQLSFKPGFYFYIEHTELKTWWGYVEIMVFSVILGGGGFDE